MTDILLTVIGIGATVLVGMYIGHVVVMLFEETTL